MRILIKEKLKQYLSHLLGIPFIPMALLEIKEPLIVHLSDTPSDIYPYLYKLLKILKPQCLIHTGDLVDDIKLEYNPERKLRYDQYVKNFIIALTHMDIDQVYIIPGNHDCIETIQSTSRDVKIIENGSVIQFKNISLGVAHYMNLLPDTGDFFLYGHNLSLANNPYNEKRYLNGIYHIHIITCHTKQVFYVPYPMGTNSLRLLTNKKIGI